MADAKQETTPAADGLAHVDDNGKVDTQGKRAWVWVQDDVTGHRYDVRGDRLPVRGLTPVDGYPLNFKTAGRPAKARQQWQAEESEATAAPAGSTTTEPAGAVDEKAAPEADASGDDQHAATAAAKPKGRTTR